MFSKAYKMVSSFTFPVILSMKYIDNTIESGLASFILLNDQGWILTAAHVVEPLHKIAQNKIEIQEYKAKVSEIQNNANWTTKQKRQKIGRLPRNNKLIDNMSHWWGADGVVITSFVGSPIGDFAVGRIENFKADPSQIYPKFRQTSDDLLGASLCKLGFPFYNIKTTWNSSINAFNIPAEVFPVPRFPIDGIGARFIVNVLPENQQTKFIETTSPGLKGQSGGPIFDTQGNICAIQVRTNHYQLGFNPEVENNGEKVIENQFLNVGVGITCESFLPFLKTQNISVEIAKLEL